MIPEAGLQEAQLCCIMLICWSCPSGEPELEGTAEKHQHLAVGGWEPGRTDTVFENVFVSGEMRRGSGRTKVCSTGKGLVWTCGVAVS